MSSSSANRQTRTNTRRAILPDVQLRGQRGPCHICVERDYPGLPGVAAGGEHRCYDGAGLLRLRGRLEAMRVRYDGVQREPQRKAHGVCAQKHHPGTTCAQLKAHRETALLRLNISAEVQAMMIGPGGTKAWAFGALSLSESSSLARYSRCLPPKCFLQ